MNENIVLFGGDTAATEYSEMYFRSGDIETLFSDIVPVLHSGSHVIVNLETALTEKDFRIDKCGPNIKSPVETAEVLKKAGITACGLSNNHIFDFGITGLRDTFQTLSNAGLAFFGSGENEEEACRPYTFMAGAKKVSVIAVCEHEYTYAKGNLPGAAPYEPFDTLFRIRDAKKEADYVVVMYHGGKEQCEYPSPRLYNTCHAFVEMGADLILCQHSHIIGTYEYYKDAFILYGQGNFHFVRYLDLPGWTTGLIVRAEFGEKMKVDLIPLDTTEHGMKLAEPGKSEEILKKLELRSRSLKDGTWIDGWMAFVESKREPYTKVIQNAFGLGENPREEDEFFASYLVCEAHMDVWQSLFPNWHAAGRDGGMRLE